VILPETIDNLMEFTARIGLDLKGAPLTLDSGFDSQQNTTLLKQHGLIPMIYPNPRNTKEPIAIARKFRWLNRELYRQRYKVERTFAWQDTYRKLVVSYERLEQTRKGFRLLAYSMINFRVTFNHP
jgi:hypothetical protein